MEKLEELGHWPTDTWFQQRLLEVRIKALRGDWDNWGRGSDSEKETDK